MPTRCVLSPKYGPVLIDMSIDCPVIPRGWKTLLYGWTSKTNMYISDSIHGEGQTIGAVEWIKRIPAKDKLKLIEHKRSGLHLLRDCYNSRFGQVAITRYADYGYHLSCLAIHQPWMGLGFGNRLMELILQTLSNANQITLDVFRDNKRAIGLYEKFGFEFQNPQEFTTGMVRRNKR